MRSIYGDKYIEVHSNESKWSRLKPRCHWESQQWVLLFYISSMFAFSTPQSSSTFSSTTFIKMLSMVKYCPTFR